MSRWLLIGIVVVVALAVWYWLKTRTTPQAAIAEMVRSSGQTTGSPVPIMARRPLIALPKTM
jgi:hypothetical protein